MAFDVLFSEPDRLSPASVLARPEIAAMLATVPTPGQLAALDSDTYFATAMLGRNVILGLADAPAGNAREVAGKAGVVGMATLAAGKVRLKGKQDRAALHILVGDRTVAESPAFARLRSLHEALLDTLARSGRVTPEDLEACTLVAAAVEPGLAAFCARIAERPGDL